MERSRAACGVAGLVVLAVVRSAGATPPPPPGGSYVYENGAPGVLVPAGTEVASSTSEVMVGAAVGDVLQDVGTLTSKVYQDGVGGTLDFVYTITPATSGMELQSLDVPWINNEVALESGGYDGAGLAPVQVVRYYDTSPAEFLFDASPAGGVPNWEGVTAELVLHTDAHAWTGSDAFTVRTIDGSGNWLTTLNGVSGLVPAHAPEPASIGVLAVGAVGLLRRRRG